MSNSSNSMTRRHWLGLGAKAVAGSGIASAFGGLARAQGTSGYRALVCVFLYGGNDGNNVLIPADTAGYQNYFNIRRGLAIAQSSLLPVQTPAGRAFGLHPRLTELQALFNQRRLSFVANVGSLLRPLTRSDYQSQSQPVPQSLFSHPDQQDQWQNVAPQAAAPSQVSGTGWAGRAADKLAGWNANLFPTSVSVAGSALLCVGQSTQPAAFTPGAPLLVAGSDGSPGGNARDAALQQVLSLDAGFALIPPANTAALDGIRLGKAASQALATATPLTTVFPSTALGAQLRQIAQFIQVRSQLGMTRQIFFCSLGGFDTHAGQLVNHDSVLAVLSPALNAFYNATVEMGISDSVTTFTESEFGRSLVPNSAGGSDHAWGGHQIVMGAGIQGGDVLGVYPSMSLGSSDDAFNNGTWIPSTSVDQFGASLASWLGVAAADLPAVFPNLANFTGSGPALFRTSRA